tara:strand:- start:18471 stop:19085 length:615 start_codon:yes stop_codon:yes gene_type:complete
MNSIIPIVPEKFTNISKPIKRLATPEEMKAIFTFYANSDWKASVNYAATIGHEDVSLGYKEYLKKELQFYKENVGDFVVAHHFEDYNITLFVFLFSILGTDNNDCYFTNDAILRIGNTFKIINDYDYFNLDQEIEELTTPKKLKAGRPKRPSDENIIKAHNIKILIDNGSLVDDACAKEKLAKSTYYRISKWIVKNTVYKSFPK